MLVGLMGALASGLPSHHHASAEGPVLVHAGHHGHGVQLVEQTERLTSQVIAISLPAAPAVDVGQDAPVVFVAVAESPQPVARGRPPPSDRPRAPPVSV
jgi:hypothetical protein